MSYKDKLNPWCIIRPVSDVQPQIVGRFRRRSDAEGHLQILKRMIPNVSYEIMFDIAPEDIDTEDLTPQPPSLQGKGELDLDSPLSNKAAPLSSPRRAGLIRFPETRPEFKLRRHSPSRLKTTQIVIFSPLERTLAMRQGF